jgi:dsRNA-specific ribonuclease
MKQVFLHTSGLVFSNVSKVPPQSNERLEFLGDSYLNFAVSNILYRSFPTLPPGDLTALKAVIVSNANLNVWARAYNLQDHLVLGFSMAHLNVPEKAEKLIADLFEAYLGGVITSNPQGQALAEEFLETLLRPMLDQRQALLQSDEKIDKMAVSKLHHLATVHNSKVSFLFKDSGEQGASDRWEAICVWSDTEVGRAKAKNMQEAKHRVAAKILAEYHAESCSE